MNEKLKEKLKVIMWMTIILIGMLILMGILRIVVEKMNWWLE
jgi:hypothetical protein